MCRGGMPSTPKLHTTGRDVDASRATERRRLNITMGRALSHSASPAAAPAPASSAAAAAAEEKEEEEPRSHDRGKDTSMFRAATWDRAQAYLSRPVSYARCIWLPIPIAAAWVCPTNLWLPRHTGGQGQGLGARPDSAPKSNSARGFGTGGGRRARAREGVSAQLAHSTEAPPAAGEAW